MSKALHRGITTTTSKFTFIVDLCIIVGLLIGACIGYYYFQQQLKVEQAQIVRESVELVAESGKIPINVKN